MLYLKQKLMRMTNTALNLKLYTVHMTALDKQVILLFMVMTMWTNIIIVDLFDNII